MQKLEPKFIRRTAAGTVTIKNNNYDDTSKKTLLSDINDKNIVQGPVLPREDWEAFTEQEKENNLESATDSDTDDDSVDNSPKNLKDSEDDIYRPEQEEPITEILSSNKIEVKEYKNHKLIKNPPMQSIHLNEKDIGLADGYRYELSGSFKPHNDFVRCVKFLNRSSRYFSSGSNDGTVAVYDLELQKVILCFRAHKDKTGLTDLSWSSNNKFLLTSSSTDRTINIWNFDTKKKVFSVKLGSGVAAACFNPIKGNHFVCGDMEGRLFWYNTQNMECKEIYRGYSIFENNSDYNVPFTALAYGTRVKTESPQKKISCWFFSGNASGRLEVFKFLQKKEQYRHIKHVSQKYAITNIVFSEKHLSNKDDEEIGVVIINSSDDKIKIYSVPNLNLIRVFFHPQRTVPLRGCIDPDSKIVITGSEDGQFRIFDIESGVLLNSIKASKNSIISSVDFSPEGIIVSASSDGEVCVWTTRTE